MRIIRHHDLDFAAQLAALRQTAHPGPELERQVRAILDDVRARGDTAVIEWGARFGAPRFPAAELAIPAATLRATAAALDTPTAAALRVARDNVREFAKRGLRRNWADKNRQGAIVGERFDPFRRVGVYVPAGTAPLVSTAIMTVTLAAAAGVPEIAVATPPAADGSSNPALLAALHLAGATEVFRMGGPQAIAALAFGTAVVRPVQKIFGPGNAYVVEAKRQVFGAVAVDLLPGPSEILVIADDSANPAWVAADLLAQAEHGAGSRIGLVTDSPALLDRVLAEVERQSARLSRQEHLAKVLRDGAYLVLVNSLADAAEIANTFAPEHLAVVARDAATIAADVTTAGAIFIGPFSPVVAGDFMAGPSHELPTGGAGHSFSGLTADQFQRRTSIVQMDAAALRRSLPTIRRFAAIEGLEAHAHSAAIRLAAQPAAAGARRAKKRPATAKSRTTKRATKRPAKKP